MVNFNPRSRKESDTVSVLCAIAVKNFNPRSRKESDLHIQHNLNVRILFQSTLSQGERL